MDILRSKVSPDDRSSELPAKILSGDLQVWDVKACGELGNDGLLDWLERSDPERPYFAFLNLMEAHRPFLPGMEARQQVMTPEEIERSFQADRSWGRMWSYTFGLHEYPAEDLSAMAAAYDACILELDRLFQDLIERLSAAGHLDDTIVVLTGDHGEHLGEHHMLDHQYSVYQGVVHVPLVLYGPGVVEPGRSSAPVSNFDVFPTLLQLAGIAPPAGLDSKAVSLLDPAENRWRLTEYPSDFVKPIKDVSKLQPDWDPTPFRRRLTALYEDRYKLIWASDGSHELYDLEADPNEERDLAASDPERLETLLDSLGDVLGAVNLYEYDGTFEEELSEEQRQRLEALGYAGGDEEEGSEQ